MQLSIMASFATLLNIIWLYQFHCIAVRLWPQLCLFSRRSQRERADVCVYGAAKWGQGSGTSDTRAQMVWQRRSRKHGCAWLSLRESQSTARHTDHRPGTEIHWRRATGQVITYSWVTNTQWQIWMFGHALMITNILTSIMNANLPVKIFKLLIKLLLKY